MSHWFVGFQTKFSGWNGLESFHGCGQSLARSLDIRLFTGKTKRRDGIDFHEPVDGNRAATADARDGCG
jgi:hypothetical protein